MKALVSALLCLVLAIFAPAVYATFEGSVYYQDLGSVQNIFMFTRDQFIIYQEFDHKDEIEYYIQSYDISLIKEESIEDIAPAGMEAFDAKLIFYNEEGYWDDSYGDFYSTKPSEVIEVEMYLSKDRLLFLGYDAYKMQRLYKPYGLTLWNFEDALMDIGLEMGKDNIWQKRKQ